MTFDFLHFAHSASFWRSESFAYVSSDESVSKKTSFSTGIGGATCVSSAKARPPPITIDNTVARIGNLIFVLRFLEVTSSLLQSTFLVPGVAASHARVRGTTDRTPPT